jgi:hypothetical protein
MVLTAVKIKPPFFGALRGRGQRKQKRRGEDKRSPQAAEETKVEKRKGKKEESSFNLNLNL